MSAFSVFEIFALGLVNRVGFNQSSLSFAASEYKLQHFGMSEGAWRGMFAMIFVIFPKPLSVSHAELIIPVAAFWSLSCPDLSFQPHSPVHSAVSMLFSFALLAHLATQSVVLRGGLGLNVVWPDLRSFFSLCGGVSRTANSLMYFFLFICSISVLTLKACVFCPVRKTACLKTRVTRYVRQNVSVSVGLGQRRSCLENGQEEMQQ